MVLPPNKEKQHLTQSHSKLTLHKRKSYAESENSLGPVV